MVLGAQAGALEVGKRGGRRQQVGRKDCPGLATLSRLLPSDFGFSISVHPQDPDTVWVFPIISGYNHWAPDGAMAMCCSRDKGNSWQKLTRGLPQKGAYVDVLRDGMAVDMLQPAGVYIGTNTGQVFRSKDEGDSWELAPDLFPPINSVKAATL